MVNQALAVISSKFKGSKPKSKLVKRTFRNAGLKNYMERVASMPAAKQASYSVGAPQFNGGKPIVIRHREYLQPLVSVTTFTGAGRYIIQPGLVDDFPWLGQIAGSFENYRFKMLRYVYRNRSATSTNGTVYTATQYDVSDPEFSSVEELMTYAGARSEVAWRDFIVDTNLNKGRAYKKYLTRTDVLPSGQDYQPYDQALFTICGVSGTAGTYLGDLLVEYEIELWNPKMNPNLLGAYGLSSGWAVSGVTAQTTPLQGLYAGSFSSYFPSIAEPVIDEAKSTITFKQVGAYDFGIHAHGASGGQTTRFETFSMDSNSVVSDLSGTSSANGGTSDWAKILVTAIPAVVSIASVITNPSAGVMDMWATIAVESVAFVANFQSKSPSLMITDAQLANLQKHFPKMDHKGYIEANKRWKKHQLLERKLVIPSEEVHSVRAAVESDSEYEHLMPRTIEVAASDKRSKSSERKDRQVRRTAD